MAEAGLHEWRERSPQDDGLIERFVPASGRLPGGIELFPCPGHTYGHHGLLMDSRWGRLIVAGDAVMTQDFFDAEEGFHNCVDFALAAQSIRAIKAGADWVIPGHGNLIVCSG